MCLAVVCVKDGLSQIQSHMQCDQNDKSNTLQVHDHSLNSLVMQR